MDQYYVFKDNEEKERYLGKSISCEDEYLIEYKKFLTSAYKLIEYTRDKRKKYDDLETKIGLVDAVHQGLERLDYLDYYIKQIHDKVNLLHIT